MNSDLKLLRCTYWSSEWWPHFLDESLRKWVCLGYPFPKPLFFIPKRTSPSRLITTCVRTFFFIIYLKKKNTIKHKNIRKILFIGWAIVYKTVIFSRQSWDFGTKPGGNATSNRKTFPVPWFATLGFLLHQMRFKGWIIVGGGDYSEVLQSSSFIHRDLACLQWARRGKNKGGDVRISTW